MMQAFSMRMRGRGGGEVSASGGNEVKTPGDGYRYHLFTSDGAFAVDSGGSVDYLIVAGGGAGGVGLNASGGGGAGGLLSGSTPVSSGSESIVVGAGGIAANGADSSAFGLTASGGGRGGVPDSGGTAGSGGCGGGGAHAGTPGNAVLPGSGSQGGDGGDDNTDGVGGGGGGAGGGGGGAGGNGVDGETNLGGDGGPGAEWPSGSGTYYGGGGGGGERNGTGVCSSGGIGGGGDGNASSAGSAGTANTGGGGGGGRTAGGNGGSGIVIVRYEFSGQAFRDEFNRADEDLETSTDWTRVGGSAGDIDITGGVTVCRTSSDGAAYQCPDLGSGDKYVQGRLLTGATQFFPLCLRLTDHLNWVGIRHNSGAFQLYRRAAGSFSLLGSYSDALVATQVVRIEMVGDDFEVFIDGVSRITATYSGNSSETRQGLVARNSIGSAMVDDFEAGLL